MARLATPDSRNQDAALCRVIKHAVAATVKRVENRVDDQIVVRITEVRSRLPGLSPRHRLQPKPTVTGPLAAARTTNPIQRSVQSVVVRSRLR
jgi:hypothetical protein